MFKTISHAELHEEKQTKNCMPADFVKQWQKSFGETFLKIAPDLNLTLPAVCFCVFSLFFFSNSKTALPNHE